MIYSELSAKSGLIFGTLFIGPFSCRFCFIISLLFASFYAKSGVPNFTIFQSNRKYIKANPP